MPDALGNLQDLDDGLYTINRMRAWFQYLSEGAGPLLVNAGTWQVLVLSGFLVMMVTGVVNKLRDHMAFKRAFLQSPIARKTIARNPFFQANGYEIHADVLDDAALSTLHHMALSTYNTRPINGEVARRQRPIESNRPHAPVLRCLDAFVGGCGLLTFEPSVLMSTREAKRQKAHRDRGQGSLIAAFNDGTYLWVAPGSHLQPTSEPSEWEHSMRRVWIPKGCAMIFDPCLVHAGGDASCPPRVHSYTIPRDRDRSPGEGEQMRPSRPLRGDFGGAARRAAERASRSPAPKPEVPVEVGMRCRAKYLASSLYPGVGWYFGVVDAISEDGTFAVRYDDGDYESGIKRRFLKVER